MGVFIKGMEMPCEEAEPLRIELYADGTCIVIKEQDDFYEFKAVPVPPHGDLIDRDALIKDGWLNLHKEVIRMGGYAIHELPLKNPSIPVIIPAEEGK